MIKNLKNVLDAITNNGYNDDIKNTICKDCLMSVAKNLGTDFVVANFIPNRNETPALTSSEEVDQYLKELESNTVLINDFLRLLLKNE